MACHPAGSHVWRWFLELCRTRGKHTIAISSLAVSQIITEPAVITWQEIAAWSQVTGRRPSLWEAQQLAIMDTVYINTINKGQGEKRKDQGVGEYCHGQDLEECRKMFGEKVLPRICGTCPN